MNEYERRIIVVNLRVKKNCECIELINVIDKKIMVIIVIVMYVKYGNNYIFIFLIGWLVWIIFLCRCKWEIVIVKYIIRVMVFDVLIKNKKSLFGEMKLKIVYIYVVVVLIYMVFVGMFDLFIFVKVWGVCFFWVNDKIICEFVYKVEFK